MHAKTQIIEHIEQHGAIDVAKYMEICISHYYAGRDPFGSDGDFTTAPEISQIFGELLGAWLLDKWQQIGKPQAILCEIGPGRGTLMHDILRITAKSGLPENIQIAMIETSPVLREIQAVKLASYNNITWYDSFAEIPKLPLLLVANEFFDALPIRQYVGNVERKIIVDANANLAFSPQGEVTFEDSPISLQIMGEICEHIKQYGGAGLIIDYGYSNAKHGDSLQALSKHKFISPLEKIGDADITAHVDFSALQKVARAAGMQSQISEQGNFLRSLGAELRAINLCKNASPTRQQTILSGLERLVSPAQMGSLFKVLSLYNKS